MAHSSRPAHSSQPDHAIAAGSRWAKRHWKGVIAVALTAFLGREFVWTWQHRVTPETVAQGQVLFEDNWTANDPLAGGGDGLGRSSTRSPVPSATIKAKLGEAGPRN